MINYLEEYKQYYLFRTKLYAGNVDYANTYAAEKSLLDALNSCTTLEEFKDKIGNKSDLIAKARVQDEQNMRLRHYEEINESVKADGCRRILQKLQYVNNVTDLITMINEEENITNQNITADSIYPFDNFHHLESLEIWEQAEVPAAYKEKFVANAAEEKESIKTAYTLQEKEMQKWCPDWLFDFERISETRHRRLLTYANEVIGIQKDTTKQVICR